MEKKRKSKHPPKMVKRMQSYAKVCAEEETLSKVLFGDMQGFITNLTENPPEETNVNTSETSSQKPAWEDDDDKSLTVKVALQQQKRHLPKGGINTRDNKFSNVLEHKFKAIVGTPSWANLNKPDEGDTSDNDILQSCGYLNNEKDKVLTKQVIEFKKMTDLNAETRSEGPFINSVEFHPNATVGLVAGVSGIASLFAVDGKRNNKLHSIKYDRFPIRCARFSSNGNEVIFGSSKHVYMYSFNLEKTESTRISLPHGVTNMQRFEVSPCGKYIAVAGRFGELHLLEAGTKELITSMRQQTKVRAMAFAHDCQNLYTHSENGQVVVYDLNTRRIINQWYDEGCVQGSSITTSPSNRYLATGSFEGIVNLYDLKNISTPYPKPAKTVLNLQTCITSLKFNSSSEVLAFGSNEKDAALRLLHVESRTVFNNFPGFDSKIPKSISLSFSPNSGFLSIGTNTSSALLYRLKYYGSY